VSADTVPVTIHILDKEYQIACKEEETEALVASADYVNKKMKEIRDRGNVIGTDRIAVVTALNIAHELLEIQQIQRSYESVNDRLSELRQRVELALQA
jgi:cell division protein ZapA